MEQIFVEAVARVAVAGAIGGLLGGFFATSRTNIIGSLLMGAIGGIAASTFIRLTGAPPIADAGQHFSYVYAFGGGLLLGFAVASSNK